MPLPVNPRQSERRWLAEFLRRGLVGDGSMGRLTRAWPSLFVVLVLASGCGRGPLTSPSLASFILDCELPAFGAMTATLDGNPWIPFSTRALTPFTAPAGLSLWASDCKDVLKIAIRDFKGVGTYDVAASHVSAELECDGQPCGPWESTGGSGSLTVTAYAPPTPGVEGSGAVEGILAFTLVPRGATAAGPGRTRVMTNGRFATRFTFGW